jgi:hypothetical protein
MLKIPKAIALQGLPPTTVFPKTDKKQEEKEENKK